jgi:hypothetical protein
MESTEKLITRSFRSKEALVTFVNVLLTRFAADRTLQLTMIIQPGKFEVSYVTIVTTGFYPQSENPSPTLVA